MPKYRNSAKIQKTHTFLRHTIVFGNSIYLIKGYVQNCRETLIELCYQWKKKQKTTQTNTNHVLNAQSLRKIAFNWS